MQNISRLHWCASDFSGHSQKPNDSFLLCALFGSAQDEAIRKAKHHRQIQASHLYFINIIAFPPTCGIVPSMKRSGACCLREVGSPRRGDRPCATQARTARRAVPTSQADALHFYAIITCGPNLMWYHDVMK